jgi:putative ABC transport system permease protein
VQGQIEEALKGPNKVALSKTAVKKYFGDNNPIGELIEIDNNDTYEVTGIYDDMPSNQHFNFAMVFSMASIDESRQKFWMSFNFVTYLKLNDPSSAPILESKFPDMIKKYIGPEVEQFMGMDLESFIESGNSAGFTLFPFSKIHLHSNKLGDLQANGDISYVYTFSAIGFFILLIACINFMNLSTARSGSRSKEVGIRKVLGAYRNSLISQFLVEATIICGIAFLLALILSLAILPLFNELAGKDLSYLNLIQPSFLSLFFGLMILVGIIAGSYPAFYLSSFKPAEVLKGKVKNSMRSGAIRSGLVIFQFSLSIIMMVGTFIIYDQMDFIQSKKLGFDKEQVIMIHDPWLLKDNIQIYKDAVLTNASVVNGTLSSYLPIGTSTNNNLFFKGKTVTGDSYIINDWRIDHDYLPTLGINLKAGRNFSKEYLSDSTAMIINQATAIKMGFGDDAVGNYISTYGGSQENPIIENYKIIGVIEDFHFESLKENIQPMVLYLSRSRGFLSFKVAPENIESTIDFMRTKWNEVGPGLPFDFSFLDQRFNLMYKSEQKISNIITTFAVIAIIIASLGLFGLASFTSEQRTKEIGVRKVMGASVSSIMVLLSKEFLKLVFIAFIIAAPLSYYFMGTWLDNFAYRTDLKLMTFVIAGIGALLIAWVTMSYLTWQAARSNPIQALRSE